MKMITAYVRMDRAAPLMRGLHEAGMGGVTAYWVRGLSGERATFLYSKRPFELSHLPESVKVEVICADESVDKVVGSIADAAKTGAPGDGIIAIQSLEQVMKTRDIQA